MTNTNETTAILSNLKLEECREVGVFNNSYFISADDPSPYRHSDDERIVVCRFPTGTGIYGAQYPIASHVLRTLQIAAGELPTIQIPTMAILEQAVIDAGYRVSAASYEDEHTIFAASVEGDGACYGHPLFEAAYSKDTGWLRVTGKPDRQFPV